MGYPDVPNWQRGEPGAAWFRTDVGGNTRVCATQGRSFIRRLQRRLNSVLRRAVGGGLLDGSPYLAVDGSLGPLTMAALAQRSDVLDDQRPGQGFRTVSEMIRSNSLSRTIGDTTMRFAIWVAYLEGTPNEWNSVVIPRGSVFPRFGQAPDDDYGFDSDHGDGGAFCWTEGAEQPPTLPTRNDVATARGTDQGRTSTGTPTARNANGASTPGEIAARNAQQPATISARWAALTNTEKGAVVVGGVLVAFAGYKLLAGKRGRRRRRG